MQSVEGAGSAVILLRDLFSVRYSFSWGSPEHNHTFSPGQFSVYLTVCYKQLFSYPAASHPFFFFGCCCLKKTHPNTTFCRELSHVPTPVIYFSHIFCFVFFSCLIARLRDLIFRLIKCVCVFVFKWKSLKTLPEEVSETSLEYHLGIAEF